MELYQITSRYFCAGIEVAGGRVVKAAPIVKYMIGRSMEWVRAYCFKKGFTIIRVAG